jgi:hypothetical protein
MEHRYTIAGVPEAKIAIRVRGLTRELRYFDEQATTTRVTHDFIVIRLRELVDLDVELHVANRVTTVGGNYRVAWINTRAEEGLYAMGLELLEPEGEIWDPALIPAGANSSDEGPVIQLECERCHQVISSSIPEAEPDSLHEGFAIACHCDPCKATTSWIFHAETAPAPETLTESSTAETPAPATLPNPTPVTPSGPQHENRQKGRAPIKMGIQIFRTKYGIDIFDICETINVSRTGVYFTTTQGYEPGERVKVVLPYHPHTMSIPVPALVVRQDERPGVHVKRVAIQMLPAA